MSEWKRLLTKLVSNAEEQFDELAARLRQRLSGSGTVKILPYLGYGTSTMLNVRGRVLEDYGVAVEVDTDGTWHNLLNMYRRLNTNDVADARVLVSFGNYAQEVTTNNLGFFEARLELDQPIHPPAFWQDLHVKLLSPTPSTGVDALARVLIPSSDAQFGIISDLDDTVIQTDVMNVLKMAQNTFLRNARTRLPFAGVAEFYQALHRGTRGLNPIYYVSNSIWNLYDLFIDFFELRNIPLGAFFLIDLGLNEDYFSNLKLGRHKSNTIETLLTTYPRLPFILIGDSGEKDPELYLKTVQQFPGRVPTIYIRDIAGSTRDEQMRDIIAQAAAAGTEMLVVPDTVTAAEHAAAQGYIAHEALPHIRRGMLQDNRPYANSEPLVHLDLNEE
ncbi:MAG: DUF2183 domain-containing protein [Anaerolineae bacterium]|nr:DUF2183 domain-containing protein [Anaerolineae bacterium]